MLCQTLSSPGLILFDSFRIGSGCGVLVAAAVVVGNWKQGLGVCLCNAHCDAKLDVLNLLTSLIATCLSVASSKQGKFQSVTDNIEKSKSFVRPLQLYL